MSTKELEKRLRALENEVARLGARVPLTETDSPWWIQIAGTFAHDPAFEQAAKLGQAYRQSLRSKSTPASKRRGNVRPRHRSR